jgi:hypothetical protein
MEPADRQMDIKKKMGYKTNEVFVWQLGTHGIFLKTVSEDPVHYIS